MTPSELELVKKLQPKPLTTNKPTLKNLFLELTPDFLIGTYQSLKKIVLITLTFTIYLYAISYFIVHVRDI